MAYRDENGKITIDDVAAGEDIRKIERAQAILQNALQSLRAAQTEGANSKGQTAQAIYDKSQELINQIQRLDNNLEETTNYIRHVLAVYKAKEIWFRVEGFNMANIRIDTDGLQNNISSMRAYVNELDSLNARTQSLLAQIASSWEGEASTAYINIMTERMQKAGQMKELLQEFLSYMEDARTKFVSRDQEGASAIRGC